MPLSRTKLKYIARHAGRKSAFELARELNLNVLQVERALTELVDNRLILSATSLKPLKSFDLGSRLGYGVLLGVIFVCPFLVKQDLWDFENLPKIALIQGAALFLGTLWFALGIRSREWKIAVSRLFLPMACFLGWALVSILWASYRYASVVQWMHWTACALICFLAVQWLSSRRRIAGVFLAILTSGALIAIFGILQYKIGLDWVRQQHAPAATFNNKNMAAQFLLAVIPAAVGMQFVARRWLSQAAASLALVPITVLLLYTGTRAAWLSAMASSLIVVALLGWSIARGRERRLSLRRMGVFLLTVGLSIGFAAAFPDGEGAGKAAGPRISRLSELVRDFSPSPSAPASAASQDGGKQAFVGGTTGIRLALYRNALAMVAERPVRGVGLANFQVRYPFVAGETGITKELQLFQYPREAHNDYLQVATELGLPGIAIFVWGFILVLVSAAGFLRDVHSDHQILRLAAFMGIAVLAVNALFSFPFYRGIPPFYFALYLAVYMRAAGFPGSSERVARPRFRVLPRARKTPLAIVGTVLFAVALLGYFALQYRWFKADVAFRYQKGYIDIQRSGKSIPYGEQARYWNPYRVDAITYLGGALLAKGDFERAHELLRKAWAKCPFIPSNLYYLAFTEYRRQRYEEAMGYLDQVMKIVPKSAQIVSLHGHILSETDRKEEALERFRLAAERGPDMVNHWNDLGSLAFSSGHFEEASLAFERALELTPEASSAPLHRALGVALYYKLDKVESGRRHLERAVKIDSRMREFDEVKRALAPGASGQ